MANLVIVESPAKALTIKGYLGSNYKVVASVGHIRDLPKSTLGIDIENGFEPHYINIRGKGDVIKQLKKEAKSAGKIFLATDPDREGEAISWHLALTLGIPLDKMCRATFNELTKSAVKEAIKAPRVIDENLVNSQQARRILDRIVGYKLSPFLWKNVKSGLSAGRVQSVATRLIVDREREIRAFVPREYWTIEPELLTENGQSIRSKFYGNRSGRIQLSSEADAMRVVSAIEGKPFSVTSVKHAQKTKIPPAPFMTSTLLQEATRKLGFQSQRVMKVAQELYEGIDLGSEFGGVQGLITYMRTDSLRVSASSQEAALALIGELYGEKYVPATPRVYKSKADAQDAHEAIRPASVSIQPKQIRKLLTSDQYRLYKLIWERFIASQMEAATLGTVSIESECAGYLFRSSGYTVHFNGYLALYDSDDGNAVEDENGDGIALAALPELRENEKLTSPDLNAQKHFTEPPARYNDGSLINVFKESGIGRPSTYATIISTIISRSYVKRDGKNLVPTPLGEITTDLMMEHFPEIVDYEFTSQMEDKLDGIEHGGSSISDVLGDFYQRFSSELERAETTVTKTELQLPEEESDVLCDKCGSRMVYKNGRFGRFLACPSYPTCRNTKALGKDGKPLEPKVEPAPIADFVCELCGGSVVERQGRYGSFYACSNYPTCRFTKQKTTDIGIACPDCGARVIIKHGRAGRVFYSCERYPECQFSSWDLPLEEKCPDCGEMLFYRKSRKLVFCRNRKNGCDYKREQELRVKDDE